MHIVTASDINIDDAIIKSVAEDDILVTDEDKPAVVILDYDRYMKLVARSQKEQSNWIDETFGTMRDDDAEALLETIRSSRFNKEIEL